jgi:hypothetical protein
VSFLYEHADSGVSSCGPRSLHEAQITCLVTGQSDGVWTAYFFEDTYFDKERSENILKPHELDDDEACEEDHVTGLLAGAIWTPREYFLKMLDSQLKRVKDEWQRIERNLGSRLRSYVSSELIPWDIRQNHNC